MNSIESLKLDFSSQIRDLGNIHNKKICDDCIYVGSGDSYVAGLIVEFLTDHRCKCYSPSDLLNSRFTEENTYCFISVTGKTKSNINVAERAAEAGARTIAITLNKKSKPIYLFKSTTSSVAARHSEVVYDTIYGKQMAARIPKLVGYCMAI